MKVVIQENKNIIENYSNLCENKSKKKQEELERNYDYMKGLYVK